MDFAEPVVVRFGGAKLDAPFPVLVPALFASCIRCPGAYSDAPRVFGWLSFCIMCPGVFDGTVFFVPLCAKADAAKSMAPATMIDFFNMHLSFMRFPGATASARGRSERTEKVF